MGLELEPGRRGVESGDGADGLTSQTPAETGLRPARLAVTGQVTCK